MKEIFSRTERLVGADAMERVYSKRVIIFGVGGVGCWCAESLVRSGIMHLTIVDSDCVSVTNINRQLMATTKTIGQPKVEVMKNRLLDINPDAEIVAIQDVYSRENADSYRLESYDIVIDAIDSLENKADLLVHACNAGVALYSSMGAALKMDCEKIAIAEFRKVKGCPLARALRNKYKRRGEFPSRKFQCVYSEEVLENKGADHGLDESQWTAKKAQVNGTIAHATAVFGFTLAAAVMKGIIIHNS